MYVFACQEIELKTVRESSETVLKEIAALKEEKVILYVQCNVTLCVYDFVSTIPYIVVFKRYLY